MVLGLAMVAVGAILLWAVDYEVAGVDLDAVGLILGIVGLVALVASAVSGRRRVVEEQRGL